MRHQARVFAIEFPCRHPFTSSASSTLSAESTTNMFHSNRFRPQTFSKAVSDSKCTTLQLELGPIKNELGKNKSTWTQSRTREMNSDHGAFNTLKTILRWFLNESKKKFQNKLNIFILFVERETCAAKSFETVSRELPECPTTSMFPWKRACRSTQNSLEERFQTRDFYLILLWNSQLSGFKTRSCLLLEKQNWKNAQLFSCKSEVNY